MRDGEGQRRHKKAGRRLERNHRLRFAFRICLQLGIDDPIAWHNAIDSLLLDHWIAFYQLEPWEVGQPIKEKPTMHRPEHVAQVLTKRYGS